MKLDTNKNFIAMEELSYRHIITTKTNTPGALTTSDVLNSYAKTGDTPKTGLSNF